MNWFQKEIVLQPRARGFHLITDEVLHQIPEIAQYRVGMTHIFIKHTSAALALNESYDPEVRVDMASHFNQLVPENAPYYTHTYEGPDDMPAHIKSVLIGCSLSIPIAQGELNLGTWQGIYLCEHRDRGGARRLVVTLNGTSG